MASLKGYLSIIVALLVANSVAACGSAEISNTFSDAAGKAIIDGIPRIEQPPPPVPNREPVQYSFHEAAQRGLIEYHITGNGGSSGPSLEVRVRRIGSEPIKLDVAPGTVFRPESSGAQSMVARSFAREIAEEIVERVAEALVDENGVIDLVDNEWHTVVMEAYCRDFELANPSAQDSFTVASVDARAAAILEAAKVQSLGVAATQVALWMDGDRLTPAAIGEHFRSATEEDFAAAARLLAQLPPPG